MEPLKRGLSLFNFCYILYILLRVRHSCLNSRYFRNSHRDWNSTLYARVHYLQGLSFITKIHLKICVELRCGRSEALDFRLCWSFWLHSYKKPPFWGLLRDASWTDAMKFSKKTEIYPELHTICRFCAAALSSEHKGLSQGLAICKVNIFHPGQPYIYIYSYIYMYVWIPVCPVSVPNPFQFSMTQADTNTVYRYCHTFAHSEAMIDTWRINPRLQTWTYSSGICK